MNELLQLAKEKLEKAHIQLEIDAYDRKTLEKCGPVVFVCNQVMQGLDEWMLFYLLAEQFPTLCLLHPYPSPPPEDLRAITVRSEKLALDPGIFQVNIARNVVRKVRKGISLALVVDFSDPPFSISDKSLLRTQVLRQLRKAKQPVVPIHFVTERPAGGLWRKALSSLNFPAPAEPLRVFARIGQPIPRADIALFDKTKPWIKFLQAKIFSLGTPFDLKPEHFTDGNPKPEQHVAEPIDPAVIAAEIKGLKPECKVASRGQFDVLIAPFIDIPHTMLEIGRLREMTFRAVGEGSGNDRDMDEYDIYYLQLIIWDREAEKIAGGYRLGQGDVIFKRFGINGLYVSSLFKVEPGFYPIMQQAVELGRSYVVPEYQRHRLPLFLLWKGILNFLIANPRYRYLYGPVSISKYYSEVSKSVIVEFVKRYYFDEEMAKLVKPRKPFQLKSRSINTRLIAENLRGEFDALENFVEDIEPAHFKVPVLFRQYLKQSARFIAFNVDPNFSDCLDGFMVLDISQLPESTIEALQQEK